MSKPSAPASRSSRTSGGTKFLLGGASLVVLGIVAVVLYTLATLSVSYSDGERAGVLQKFSRKGWICKTHEGELAVSYTPGMAPVIWYFSVRDEAVAAKVKEAQGKRVVVHYDEHRGVPSDCFGESQYYVDGVRVIE
ncbi:MAG TPA: hypothetical protein VK540_08530 [Polyangiaceae bacterium]|jgi:hypothetical protein|nr:hypothetical protein [Polyangiaceae bacterium]